MLSSSKLAIIIALVILVQLLVLDITKYYNVMIDIFSGEKKIRHLDVILFILLLPSSIFMFIDIKILNSESMVKRIQRSKLYRWLKTEIEIKK